MPGRIAVSSRAAAVWQTATLTEIRRETPRASTFRFAVPAWAGHLPGQHLMLRLTAEDGYVAQRHYSIASAPDDSGHIELTLDHVEGVRSPAGSTRWPGPVTASRCAARSVASSPGPATGPRCWSAPAPESYR